MKPEKHTTKREREIWNFRIGIWRDQRERERVMQGKFKKKINVKTCNNKICMFRYIYTLYIVVDIYIYLTYMSM